MKAAICTTNGSKVDLHFDKTSVFYIYEVENGVKTLLEKRIVEKYNPSDESEKSREFNWQKFTIKGIEV